MTRIRRRDRPRIVALAPLIVATLMASATESRADRITLRGGGQVRGKLIRDKAQPDVLLFLGEVGKTPMVFKKDQVVQVVPEASPLDEYVARREVERPDAPSEYDLGVWAEEHGLSDLAQVHYEAAVKRDSTFGPAHQKLGHVERDGRWLNSDEIKEAQGMVKYRGRWITVEEKDRKEAEAASVAEGATWVKRIKILRDAYVNGTADRSQEAERRLLAIHEPAAVGPVVRVLGADPIPALRIIAARILATIPGSSASTALVGRLLAEIDGAVREATMTALAGRDQGEVVPGLIRGLRATEAEVVNRAAWGLSNLNAVAAVPRLIPALITVEQRVVMTGGSGPSGNFGVSFNNADTPASGYGIYSGQSIPMLTPPAVGPGVVAFGATSVPYGAFNGPTLSTGTGGSKGPVPRIVPVEHQNAEVLAALVKMTGQDFGFDIASWKKWVSRSFRIDSGPTRRVPQP